MHTLHIIKLSMNVANVGNFLAYSSSWLLTWRTRDYVTHWEMHETCLQLFKGLANIHTQYVYIIYLYS